ncbi:MAG: hypothetical protein OXI91_14560 [Chloroflexota bacterium]|nr:hypothetical protein [Chloroflexota bacterium]
MTTPNPDAPQREEEIPSYHVSFDRLDQLNRSAITLLAARRPAMVPSMLKEDSELDNPQEILAEIAEYCGSEEDFIDSGMPLQEIIFRTLLARRNEPMTLNELHDELTQRWSTPVRPINLTMRTLERILGSDDYYGFARVED